MTPFVINPCSFSSSCNESSTLAFILLSLELGVLIGLGMLAVAAIMFYAIIMPAPKPAPAPAKPPSLAAAMGILCATWY